MSLSKIVIDTVDYENFLCHTFTLGTNVDVAVWFEAAAFVHLLKYHDIYEYIRRNHLQWLVYWGELVTAAASNTSVPDGCVFSSNKSNNGTIINNKTINIAVPTRCNGLEVINNSEGSDLGPMLNSAHITQYAKIKADSWKQSNNFMNSSQHNNHNSQINSNISSDTTTSAPSSSFYTVSSKFIDICRCDFPATALFLSEDAVRFMITQSNLPEILQFKRWFETYLARVKSRVHPLTYINEYLDLSGRTRPRKFSKMDRIELNPMHSKRPSVDANNQQVQPRKNNIVALDDLTRQFNQIIRSSDDYKVLANVPLDELHHSNYNQRQQLLIKQLNANRPPIPLPIQRNNKRQFAPSSPHIYTEVPTTPTLSLQTETSSSTTTTTTTASANYLNMMASAPVASSSVSPPPPHRRETQKPTYEPILPVTTATTTKVLKNVLEHGCRPMPIIKTRNLSDNATTVTFLYWATTQKYKKQGLVHIGCTNNPRKRISMLNVGNEDFYEYLIMYKVSNRSIAENLVSTTFADQLYNSNGLYWFGRLDYRFIQEIMDGMQNDHPTLFIH